MPDDRLDIVVFGATGYTGRYTVAEVHRQAKQRQHLKWGIAGRSEEKLKTILKNLEEKTGDDLSNVRVIIADLANEESLKQMAESTRLIINCTGPYRFYGEPVVKACIEAGTHHVDVSGEPQYMERMQLEYNKAAQEKGIYIVSACGFDSIPAEMGIIYIENKFDGTINSVETYLQTWLEGGPASGSLVNYGTWESAVYGLAHANELRSLRRQLFPERLPKFEPRLKRAGTIHKSEAVGGKWCVPFPGSDRSVVMRSQRYFFEHEKKRPIQMEAYLAVQSFLGVVLLAIFGGIFSILCKFAFGRKLLLSYPRFFTLGYFAKEEPKKEDCERTHFSITFVAKGWSSDKKLAEPTDQYTEPPNKTMIARVQGKDPGYGATVVALVLSGLTILEEQDKMPKPGGVLPPGAAFAKTSLIEKLNANGLTFEILNVKTDD